MSLALLVRPSFNNSNGILLCENTGRGAYCDSCSSHVSSTARLLASAVCVGVENVHGGGTTTSVVPFEGSSASSSRSSASRSVATRDIIVSVFPSPIGSAIMPPLNSGGSSSCDVLETLLMKLTGRSTRERDSLAATTHTSTAHGRCGGPLPTSQASFHPASNPAPS